MVRDTFIRKTIREPDWVNQPQYEPHFDEFAKHRDYQGQIKKWREKQAKEKK